METSFKVTYHPAVGDVDLPRIDLSWQRRIFDAINERLMTRPDLYGKPLRDELKGHFKLRVGDYRVVYKIHRFDLKIIAIVHRSSNYKNVGKRLG